MLDPSGASRQLIALAIGVGISALGSPLSAQDAGRFARGQYDEPARIAADAMHEAEAVRESKPLRSIVRRRGSGRDRTTARPVQYARPVFQDEPMPPSIEDDAAQREFLPPPRGRRPREPYVEYDGAYVEQDIDFEYVGDHHLPGPPAGPCASCGEVGCTDCTPCYECDWDWAEALTLEAGVHGFTSPLDLGTNGNFGFHTGFNWGAPLWYARHLGVQFGYGYVRSNFHGEDTGAPGDDRSQHFITAGLFHRPIPRGLQYGVVVDWLDDTYFEDVTLSQLRTEISYVAENGREFGFMGAFHLDDDPGENALPGDEYVEPFDQYLFFLRRRFDQSGEGRVFAGLDDLGDPIFGAEARLPLTDKWALETNFVYLGASETRGETSADDAAWSTVINLVLYPRHNARGNVRNIWRPLFDVANNTWLLLDRRNQ